jgi:hypothetical protein
MTGSAIARSSVVLAVALSACGVGAEQDARVTPDGKVPFDLLDPEAPALVPSTDGSPYAVCLVGDAVLRPIARRLETDVSEVAVVRSLVEEVSDAEAAQGLRTALTSDVAIRSVTVHRGTAIVDFEAAPDLVGEDRILAVAQIVCTLAYQPGIGQVSFTVQGAPVQVPIGDGSLTSDPVSLDDFAMMTAGQE